MEYQWKVTKYNPLFRNDRGHYLIDEWTCPSEIGKTINGTTFTFQQYLAIEQSYVETILAFLNELGLHTLRAIRVSDRSLTEEDKTSILYEEAFSEITIKEDQLVHANEIPIIVRMILRNFTGCQFFSKDHFFVHFGWDYYMYIGSSLMSINAITFAGNSGLFVEEMRSPYLIEEKDVIRIVQWSEKDAEIPYVVDDEQINLVSLEEYRKWFDLSEEHPVIGSFEITKAHVDFFQPLLKHQLNFSKYDYSLCASD